MADDGGESLYIHSILQGYRRRTAGEIRHFGFSFYNRAEVLAQVLTEYPQVEAVQIQFNHLDFILAPDFETPFVQDYVLFRLPVFSEPRTSSW